MKRLLLGLFFGAAFGFAVGTSTAEGAADQRTCVGYEQTRQFVDTQSWWTPAESQDGDNFGHIHAGACIPERESLSTNQPLDARFILHDNPGRVTYVAIVYKGVGYEDSYSFDPGWTMASLKAQGKCNAAGDTCEVWHPFTIEMSKFREAGLQEVRIRATVREPDGAEERVSMNFQLTVRNGRTVANVTREPYLRGKGWYTDLNYAEATLMTPLPDGPVSGIWRPRVRMIDHEDSAQLSGWEIRIDPDFHNGFAGLLYANGLRQLAPTDLAIDTTTLADGQHKLFLKAYQIDTARDNTNAGILVVPFTVQNGGTLPPTPTQTASPAPTPPPATPTPTTLPTASPTPRPTVTPTPAPVCEMQTWRNGIPSRRVVIDCALLGGG